LILVDSSVWIEFFSSSPGYAGDELRRMIADAESFALTGVVVTEILPGLTRDVGRIERYLSQWEMFEPSGFRTYRDATVIFRQWRAKGVSLTPVCVYSRQGLFPDRAADRPSFAPAAATLTPTDRVRSRGRT
jgi:predicted nucleic acid-binding protein